jgi:hypothetical protein
MSTKADMEGAYADTDALVGLVFALSGKFTEPHAALTSLIKRNAADVKASVTKAVTHLVSTMDDVEAKSTKVQKALASGIPIVTERWVRESIEANEPLPLRPEFVLHPGSKPLAESEDATKPKSPRTASIDEGRKAEQPGEASTAEASKGPAAAAAAPAAAGGAEPGRIDESRLPSTLLTQAKDAALPVLHPTIGEMHPPEHPAVPSEPLKEEQKQKQQQPIVASTEAPAALPYAPSVAAAAAAAAAETARIESTAAADIPPVAPPTHEALMQEASSAPGAMMRMEEEAEERVEEPRGGEKRKVEEAQGPLEGLVQLEEPPHKRQKKLDEGAAAAGETPVVEMAGGEEAAGELRSESAATPSGAETGGPSAMQVTQRTYDLKVLERKEHGPSTAHELGGQVEKQLLEGINVHNDSTAGFGSLAEVFARGVDGGAVLVESVRDYHGQDNFTLITYGRGGKEFGSLHRNDEVISCGLMRDGKLSAVRAEDADLMDRLMHVHVPIVPIASSTAS